MAEVGYTRLRLGRGWGWGWRDSFAAGAIFTSPHHPPPPPPAPPPTQAGLARLAQEKTRPGQARGAWGRQPTKFAARTSPALLRISKDMTASVTRTISLTLNGEKVAAEIKPHHNLVELL